MAERLTHQRTKGPASTPAQRLIELTQEINFLTGELEIVRAELKGKEREYDRYHTMMTSFGNIPMAQIWGDLWLWEAVMNEQKTCEAVFEIGTWNGGFSAWLWAQCQIRDWFFQTYDAVEPEREIPGFRRVDVFAESAWLGSRFRAFEPCIVFCDGGNKPRELQTFAEELEDPASLLAVHDWGNEIGPDDVPDTVEMVYGEVCEEMGSLTRFFRLENDEPQG